MAVLACCGTANAADVFASTGTDGSPRYATERLDSSYHIIYTEPGSSALPQASRSTLAPARHRAMQLRPIIERIAKRHGLAPALVEAVIAVESGYNTNALSPKGARGAMQLMPSTAVIYGLRTPAQLHDPERNIDAGVRFLKDLIARHNGNVALALAAYNAGTGAVARHGDRIPPYTETMLYVPAVLARSVAQPGPSSP